MDLSLRFNIREAKIDDKHNTIITGILEADSLSANGRFYPADVVTSAANQIPQLPMRLGHSGTDNPSDIVARGVAARMQGKVLMGEFKFGTDAHSQMIFRKIADGLIESVSIRASGDTHRAKMAGDFVDVIDSLSLASVDLVSEGGVQAAKIVKVFESAPEFQEFFKEEKWKNLDEFFESSNVSYGDKREVMSRLMGVKDRKHTESVPYRSAKELLERGNYQEKRLFVSRLMGLN